MFYICIIFLTMIFVYSYTLPLAFYYQCYSLFEAIFGPLFILALLLVLLGLVCVLLRLFIPYKSWDYKKRFFKVSDAEFEKIKKINVPKWKDLVPEMGKTANFPKDKLYSLDVEYLYKFLQETCFAELMHEIVGFLPFLILFFLPQQSFLYALPLLFVNLILHSFPCIIQRYVRFKLSRLYEKKLAKEKTH